VYKTVLEECKSVLSTMEKWRKEQLLKITEGYKPKVISYDNDTELFFRLSPTKTRRKEILPMVRRISMSE
jgi:hypothetical protein